MTNYLYRLTPTTEGEKCQRYDCYDAFLVCAPSSTQAREELDGAGGDEACELLGLGRADYWQNPTFTACERLGAADDGVEPGIIMSSFHAG